VLAKIGLKELAYTLLLNKDYPSWGYSIANGATTVWERWDGYKDGGKHKDAMNSFNHFVFGSAAFWLYEGVLGFSPIEDFAGFKKVKIHPYFDESDIYPVIDEILSADTL
jgi:alpha-L-rhamnosidase